MPTPEHDPSGVHLVPPEISLKTQAAVLGNDAVVVMIQPHTFTSIDPDTGASHGDVVEMAVRATGGQPVGWPPEFTGATTAGWTGEYQRMFSALDLRHHHGRTFYRGTLPVTPAWLDLATTSGTVVVVTGPIAGPADINPVISAGRALWVRVPLTIL
ncbi:hypothetical protein [Nocardia carnea]|uniref:hypothetical protein n=1 Tax=Nocardia carnea TaxID=37328 RepID=UPI002454EFC2|nr:hypothetical protein [Nocardia carnea]